MVFAQAVPLLPRDALDTLEVESIHPDEKGAGLVTGATSDSPYIMTSVLSVVPAKNKMLLCLVLSLFRTLLHSAEKVSIVLPFK